MDIASRWHMCHMCKVVIRFKFGCSGRLELNSRFGERHTTVDVNKIQGENFKLLNHWCITYDGFWYCKT